MIIQKRSRVFAPDYILMHFANGFTNFTQNKRDMLWRVMAAMIKHDFRCNDAYDPEVARSKQEVEPTDGWKRGAELIVRLYCDFTGMRYDDLR